MPSAAAPVDPRRLLEVNAETVAHVSSNDFPGHWPGEDHSWDLEQFRKTFQVHFEKNEPNHAEFDLIHIDASVANAFRRIMMAEIETWAIENVYIFNNTSVMQDEVLAQRLGLVPLTGDRKQLKHMSMYPRGQVMADGSDPPITVDNTLVMRIQVLCERIPGASKDETDPDKLYRNHSVYARDLEFTPTGAQIARFDSDPVRPTHPDILLMKLRPGQEINLEVHCHKGVGKDHAKFQPTCPASYRLMPHITLKEPIKGKAAETLQKCFSPGTIRIVNDKSGGKVAKVANPRNDTVSREVLRHEQFRDKVALGRIRDHFIYSVESTGQYYSDDIFLQSIDVLQEKCAKLKRHTLRMLREEEKAKAMEEMEE